MRDIGRRVEVTFVTNSKGCTRNCSKFDSETLGDIAVHFDADGEDDADLNEMLSEPNLWAMWTTSWSARVSPFHRRGWAYVGHDTGTAIHGSIVDGLRLMARTKAFCMELKPTDGSKKLERTLTSTEVCTAIRCYALVLLPPQPLPVASGE